MALDDVGQWQWWAVPPGLLGSPGMTETEIKKRSRFCSASHVALATTLQSMLTKALPAPWQSWDGAHRSAVRVTGNLNTETLAAVYAYLTKYVDAGMAESFKLRMLPTRRWTREDLAILVWLAYYTWNYAVDAQGKVTQVAPQQPEADIADLIVTATPEVKAVESVVSKAARDMEMMSWPRCMSAAEFLSGPQEPGVIQAKGTSSEPAAGASSAKPTGSSSALPLLAATGAAVWWFFFRKKP